MDYYHITDQMKNLKSVVLELQSILILKFIDTFLVLCKRRNLIFPKLTLNVNLNYHITKFNCYCIHMWHNIAGTVTEIRIQL